MIRINQRELYTDEYLINDCSNKIKAALELLGKGSKSVREMRTLIMGLEAVMKSMPGHLTGEDFKTTHHFDTGIYMRECLIPKGVVVTGKIHTTGHSNILAKGTITVWTEDGMKTISAPAVIKSNPGIKRVGYAHEDSVWITVHLNPDDERDVKKVESRLYADTFEGAYLATSKSYQDAVAFLGFTEDEVQRIVKNESDVIDFPESFSGAEVSESDINGMGLFSTKNFNAGDVVAPARINNFITPAGRYCNHSGNPNVKIKTLENGNVDLIAIKDIEIGEEILSDYYFSFELSRDLKGVEQCQQ